MYNKSEIMRNANAYAKTTSRSAAMKKAWALAKIEKIDDALFMLNMKDRWNAADWKMSGELENERRRLVKSIEEPKPEPMPLTDEEIAEIGTQMEIMFNSGNIDWEAYGKLERRLAGRAA